MSLPHYRGNQKPGDMNRNPNSGGGRGVERVDEVNQSLLEAQNDQRWVRENAEISTKKNYNGERVIHFVACQVKMILTFPPRGSSFLRAPRQLSLLTSTSSMLPLPLPLPLLLPSHML